MVTGQAPVTLELWNTPEKKHKPKVVHLDYISQLTQFMPPPETYTSESGVSLRCARSILLHTSHYSRLKNRLYRLPPRKDYHVYITRSTYHYACARQTQVKWKKKQRKEKKKKRKESEKEKERKDKRRQDKKRKQGKE